ncbi:hypothetical protein CHELA1G11_12116 [Hyphomicrobiales bacterium]|nr:hypothetical protein CHELA1G11_12116 [Hyphomicrobiales bacterium]CAH1663191.1 hypothetical protein CHELA1G2_12197 [Hyphomicrobiales bacterium]
MVGSSTIGVTGRLSLLYAALFFELGVNLPFFPLRLHAQALSSDGTSLAGGELGGLMAVLTALAGCLYGAWGERIYCLMGPRPPSASCCPSRLGSASGPRSHRHQSSPGNPGLSKIGMSSEDLGF